MVLTVFGCFDFVMNQLKRCQVPPFTFIFSCKGSYKFSHLSTWFEPHEHDLRIGLLVMDQRKRESVAASLTNHPLISTVRRNTVIKHSVFAPFERFYVVKPKS